jgi:magnesium-transporting ATPase (P-type)
MDGKALGIVIATGDKSMIGQIAKSTSTGVHQQTTLEAEI